jgi:hypothetical protein
MKPTPDAKRENQKLDSPPKNPIRYTLSPLVQDGRNSLVCRDVKGMEWAMLECVEFYYGGSPWQRITRQSDDIFALVERKVFKWPALERITSARFRVRLKTERRVCRITIHPAAQASDKRLGTNPVIQDWLKKRGFLEIIPNEGKSLE